MQSLSLTHTNQSRCQPTSTCTGCAPNAKPPNHTQTQSRNQPTSTHCLCRTFLLRPTGLLACLACIQQHDVNSQKATTHKITSTPNCLEQQSSSRVHAGFTYGAALAANTTIAAPTQLHCSPISAAPAALRSKTCDKHVVPAAIQRDRYMPLAQATASRIACVHLLAGSVSTSQQLASISSW